MTKTSRYMEEILSEINQSVSEIDFNHTTEIIETLYNCERIFLTGAGRSGLAIRSFGNRLMHLGNSVHLVGDVSTPSIQQEDVLVISSGSGETESLVIQAEKAKKQGAKVILFTTNQNSRLGKAADKMVIVKAADKDSDVTTLQPMGSLFEQVSLLLFDAIVLEWKELYQTSYETMKKRHANME